MKTALVFTLSALLSVKAFSPLARRLVTTGSPTSNTRLYFFRRGNDDKDPSLRKEKEDDSSSFPFFGRLIRKKETPEKTEITGNESKSTSSTLQETKPKTVVVTPSPSKNRPNITEWTPEEMRKQAEKVRLEAERLDAELTLQKINKLEKEISKAKSKGKESVEDLQKEMDALLAKMRGEPPPRPAVKQANKPSTSSVSRSDEGSRIGAGGNKGDIAKVIIVPPDEDEVGELVEFVNKAPTFMKKTLASQVELDYKDVEDINATELAIRLDKMRRLDFSYSTRPKPTFTAEEIEGKKQAIKTGWAGAAGFDERLKEAAGGNETKLALLALEYEYYVENGFDMTEDQLEKLIEDDEWIKNIVDAVNKSAVDSTIETLYPKCTRKEGKVPTLAQVNRLVSEILPKASFSTVAKPEPVAGGYVIRGTSRTKNGDELIQKIDVELAKAKLDDKLTVLYTNDFTIFATADPDADGFDPDNQTPILYVTGPDLVREPRPVLLSMTTALGLATCWYLSIYPFLLNSDIAKRVDEQLALADANMAPDLAWLTDLSVPLFVAFVGIQLLHDLAHRLVASSYNIKTTVPTFVPSIITGITSSVTSFQSLPKNKQAMFDYSVAGPLTGMVASVAAIAIGSQLTIVSDPAMFPALPLEILRQSTLGGGIIDSILGNGALSVPEGALGTQAVAGMTIPLHPVAVAGYISLLVNALNVLPIGTTDGGRMGLALFGRGAKLLVGNLFLFLCLSIGLVGSDLFLFYFAFCIAFQSGNEVPARNEVDKVDFSRVAVAASAYVLALLALIPFQ